VGLAKKVKGQYFSWFIVANIAKVTTLKIISVEEFSWSEYLTIIYKNQR
jgi:hypothetical protein